MNLRNSLYLQTVVISGAASILCEGGQKIQRK